MPDEIDRSQRGNPLLTASWQRALYLPVIILAWLAVVVVAGWLLTHVAKTVLVLVLSGIVAYALTPLVAILSRWMPRWLAIALAYVLGFSLLLGLGAILVDTAANQVINLVNNLPKYEQQLKRFEPRIVSTLGPFGITQAKINHTQQQAVAYLQGAGTGVATQTIGIVSGILNTLIDLILILILSVYLTANGPKIAKRLRRETPLNQRWRMTLVITIVNQVVGGYIRGTFAMATLIGVLVGGGMLLLHVPYAILLGLLAFFMEFIPIIGVLVSGAVCIVVALFQGWVLAVVVLAYFVVVHIIEGDIVGPRVMGKAVGIHPATALIGLVAGTEIFGIWGALFAAPLAGLLQAIGTAAWRESRGSDPPAVVQAVVAKEKQDAPGLPTGSAT